MIAWTHHVGYSFEIYTFREGDFVLQGDGGFQNVSPNIDILFLSTYYPKKWAYGGNVIKGTAKEKKLTLYVSTVFHFNDSKQHLI